jgi:hypothetical protein
MRVEKREFALELMRVEKREFAREFSQLSCPGQTKTRVARELTYITERVKTLINPLKFEPVQS